MAELINNAGYHDFTLETLQTPDGITRLNSIIRQLAQNISSDGEGVRIYQGYGTPEASIAAGIGSLYMRVDGGADTSVYRKESGSGNTGWVAIKAPASLPLTTANGGLGADFSSGTAGNILYFSSTGAVGQRSLSTFQVFTASGSFTAPTGITKAYVTMIGGGGGGGGGTSSGGGGGGQAGWYVVNYPYTVVAASSYTVTIGAGGTAGSTAPGNGGTGGTTSFDTLSVIGGNGGKASNVSSGAGGAAGTDPRGPGAPGASGASFANGEHGAGSIFGTGASGTAGTPSNGASAAANSGAGGAGADSSDGSSHTGGVGGSGICVVSY